MRKTKIICTLGPAVETEEMMKKLMLSGMDIARINFSHGTREELLSRVNIFKKVREELKLPIPLLLDTKGPEIRIGCFKEECVELKEGQLFILTTNDVDGDRSKVSISYKGIINDIREGIKILIADGLIELIVKENNDTDIICEVKNGGLLSNHKNVNIPEANIHLPALTQKDIEDIKLIEEFIKRS
jgi:pyruvate kinase